MLVVGNGTKRESLKYVIGYRVTTLGRLFYDIKYNFTQVGSILTLSRVKNILKTHPLSAGLPMRNFAEAGRHSRWSCLRWSSPTTVAKGREEEEPMLSMSATTAT